MCVSLCRPAFLAPRSIGSPSAHVQETEVLQKGQIPCFALHIPHTYTLPIAFGVSAWPLGRPCCVPSAHAREAVSDLVFGTRRWRRVDILDSLQTVVLDQIIAAQEDGCWVPGRESVPAMLRWICETFAFETVCRD